MSAEGRTAALAVRPLGSGSSEFCPHGNVETDFVDMRIDKFLSSHEAMDLYWRYESGEHADAKNASRTPKWEESRS
jgi:hypothetical protein